MTQAVAPDTLMPGLYTLPCDRKKKKNLSGGPFALTAGGIALRRAAGGLQSVTVHLSI